MKICRPITVRPDFHFQKIFILDGFAIKLCFNAISNFILTSLCFFIKLLSLIKNIIHLVSPSYLFNTHLFWKHYTSYFNFIIIILVTNEISIMVFTRRNYTRYFMLTISKYSNKIRFLRWWHLHFSIPIPTNVIKWISLSIFYTRYIKNYLLRCSSFLIYTRIS